MFTLLQHHKPCQAKKPDIISNLMKFLPETLTKTPKNIELKMMATSVFWLKKKYNIQST